MNVEQPIDLALCPECGAALPATDAKCWMCGSPNVTGSWTDRRLAARKPVGEFGDIGIGALVLVAVAATALFIGLVSDVPGMAMLFLVVVTPGLLATWFSSQAARRKGQPLAWYSKLARFVVSTVIVLGAVAVLSVAFAVAMFIFCIYALTGH